MPRRGKVVDLRTGLDAAPPALGELLGRLPASAEDRRAAARRLGLTATRRGLVTILAGCAPDAFGFDDHVFGSACDLLAAIGPGRERRFLELARSGHFDDERSNRLLRAATRSRTPGGEKLLPHEVGLAMLPDVRALMLSDEFRGRAVDLARRLNLLAIYVEAARLETGVRVVEVWGDVLRRADSASLHEFAATVLALERGDDEARRLLAEVLPSLPPETRRHVVGALNGHTPRQEPDPSTETWTAAVSRPRLQLGPVDGRGDVIVSSEIDGLDGLGTYAWLHLRLGVGVRSGGVRTNLTLAALSDLAGDVNRYGLGTEWTPDIAHIGACVRDALAASPGPHDADTAAALRLVLREVDRGEQVQVCHDPVEDAPKPTLDAAGVAYWRQALTWRWQRDWQLDAGDRTALGIVPLPADTLPKRERPAKIAADTWHDREIVRRSALVPASWLRDATERLAGTPLPARLVRMLRGTAPLLESWGHPGAAELYRRTADLVEREPQTQPIVRAWLERSALPGIDGESLPYDRQPRDDDLVEALHRVAPRRPAPARLTLARAHARVESTRLWTTRFAEDRPALHALATRAWALAGG